MIRIGLIGLREAIQYFQGLSNKVLDYAMEGMERGAGEIQLAMDVVIPHSTMIAVRGFCVHSEYVTIVDKAAKTVRCGTRVPYIKILEYGSEATAGEFPYYTIGTKSGRTILGQFFDYLGQRWMFYLRGKPRPLKPFRYMRRTLKFAILPVKQIITEAVKYALRK